MCIGGCSLQNADELHALGVDREHSAWTNYGIVRAFKTMALASEKGSWQAAQTLSIRMLSYSKNNKINSKIAKAFENFLPLNNRLSAQERLETLSEIFKARMKELDHLHPVNLYLQSQQIEKRRVEEMNAGRQRYLDEEYYYETHPEARHARDSAETLKRIERNL